MAEQQPRPILITGAGRRIGLALAHHFLQQRQPVIVSYRTPYPAIDGLREAGALCLQADFSSDDGILTFAEAVKSHTDGLRAIIHNASDWMAEKPGVPLSTVINRMMQIHVNAPYLLNHALEALLRGHGHAASDIIHITDYVVERGSDKHIAYAASKAALLGAVRSLGQEVAKQGIRANCIAPGYVRTPLLDALGQGGGNMADLLELAPLGMGEPEDVAGIVVFLSSDEAAFITGQVISVSGGLTMAG